MTYEEFSTTNSRYYRGFKISFSGFFTENIGQGMFVHNSLGSSFEEVIERTKPMIDKYIEELK